MTALTQRLAYLAPSALVVTEEQSHLALQTAWKPGDDLCFFEGDVGRPALFSRLLLAVGLNARVRYAIDPSKLALAEADPVVTSDDTHLRFESFSACGSAYMRLDMPHGAFSGRFAGRGTTNVDLNPPTRVALGTVRASQRLGLAVGRESLRIETETNTAVERRVSLPMRWIRGFLEVQAIQRRMRQSHVISGPQILRFLRSLPRQKVRNAVWVVAAGRGLRLTRRPARDGLKVGGLERLRALEAIAGNASSLAAFGEESGASAWVMEFGEEARLTYALSPSHWRGFSGEGQALESLATELSDERVSRVHSALAWQGGIDAAALAASLGLEVGEVIRALTRLGGAGKVGFDLMNERYFHRELPFDLGQIERLQPRLANARDLVDRVSLHPTAEGLSAQVPGSGVTHTVTLNPNHCTCVWFSKHQGERGPCKHILATQLAADSRKGGDEGLHVD